MRTYVHTYIRTCVHTYVRTYILLHFHARWGRRWAAEGERGRGRRRKEREVRGRPLTQAARRAGARRKHMNKRAKCAGKRSEAGLQAEPQELALGVLGALEGVLLEGVLHQEGGIDARPRSASSSILNSTFARSPSGSRVSSATSAQAPHAASTSSHLFNTSEAAASRA